MSYSVVPDYGALPTALLPLAKQHMRVDFTDDDVLITEYLGQAISLCEAFWELQVFGAAVAWSPGSVASRYPCPVRPVSDFTVMSAAVDVSAEYALEGGSLTQPTWLVHSDGSPFPADAAVTLVAGYATPDQMPPNARGAILQVAATRYENRESIVAYSLDQIPFWLSDLLGGLWVPRA